MSAEVLAVLSLELAGNLDEVGRVNDSIAAIWQQRNLPEGNQLDVLLCLEEVLSNVIRHGRAKRDTREIRVEARFTEREVEIRITDDGVGFDPLSYPPPRLDVPLQERRKGGLGVHLVRTLMDRVHYERRAGRNVFTMARRLTATI